MKIFVCQKSLCLVCRGNLLLVTDISARGSGTQIDSESLMQASRVFTAAVANGV